MSNPAKPQAKPAPKNTCDLMSWSGILIQLLLCAICLGGLIIKRLLEKPQRAWLIWLLDITKQIAGMTIIHVYNVIMAMVIAKPSSGLDQCAWYWIQYNIDVFLGTVLNWGLMKACNVLFEKCRCPSMVSGNYFDRKTNRISFWIWLAQTGIWSLVVLANKWIMYAMQIPIIKVLQLFSKIA